MIEIAPIAGYADEQLSLDAYNEVWPHAAFGLAEVHSFKSTLLDHVDLLAREGGEVVGSGFSGIRPGFPELAFMIVTVLRGHRRRGAGTALYRATSDWARERGLDTLEVRVADDDSKSLAFAQKRGFVEQRREKGVALDLTAIEPPAVQAPPGIEIVTWAERPELAHGMFEVSVEASPDVPGYEDEQQEPFEDWLAHEMQGSGDRPEATFVAVAGDEVVGYAKFSLTDAMPTTAHHDMTAVRRAWRKRGIARALKTTQITWAKANGYEQLQTVNDERNTAMRRLNADLGYRPSVGQIFLRGPLA